MPGQNAMQIFTLLDKSNCGKCGDKTCLAFAGAVFTGRKSIDACPTLETDIKERFRSPGNDGAEAAENYLEEMTSQLATLDFSSAAERSGATLKNGWISARVMGKEFRVNREGRFSSDIHITNWVTGPFLSYILHGKGLEPTGNWITYREVDGGRERYGLFQQRAEADLRKVADAYPDLFRDMVEVFQGSEVENQFEADISVVLMPLPKVPVMISYWLPEDGLESSLNIFFDETVNDNLGNDGIYSICTGLTTMFEKLAERHGFKM
ncbi:DUF3786 domain-containing protein [Desulfosediminicola ganghwensis]|uniref:DUF3786 domain-containing protein n=1 Tax=Desulfosediminicola ganghwensis TaxID=2569540 RepID=UPI0010AB6441|nr:DUF3786 domain-containing protein [Desulfosediminicola ganghwensis]